MTLTITPIPLLLARIRTYFEKWSPPWCEDLFVHCSMPDQIGLIGIIDMLLLLEESADV
jgi:hypothetical protein